MCSGKAPELDPKDSFVGAWVNLLRPGYDRLAKAGGTVEPAALEREAVLVSLDNLMTFPFVREAVEQERLTLHGLWNDIGAGGLECYDSERGGFVAV